VKPFKTGHICLVHHKELIAQAQLVERERINKIISKRLVRLEEKAIDNKKQFKKALEELRKGF